MGYRLTLPYQRANQGVVSAGHAHYEELKIKTIDTGYARAGRLVIRDTDDDHCKVAGAGSDVILGFLSPRGVENTSADYTTEDWVKVGKGPVVVALTATTGQTIVKGQNLYPAAHGAVKNSATSTERPIGKAAESVTTTTLAEAPINVEFEQ